MTQQSVAQRVFTAAVLPYSSALNDSEFHSLIRVKGEQGHTPSTGDPTSDFRGGLLTPPDMSTAHKFAHRGIFTPNRRAGDPSCQLCGGRGDQMHIAECSALEPVFAQMTKLVEKGDQVIRAQHDYNFNNDPGGHRGTSSRTGREIRWTGRALPPPNRLRASPNSGTRSRRPLD